MAENTNDSQVVETEEELTNYTTETNAGAGTGTSAIEPGYGTGRRKEAVARVRLVPGDGKWTINGRTLEEYFPSKLLQREVNSPIVLLKLEGKFDAIVLVDGGGTTGQAGAIRLGVARALNAIDRDANRAALKKAGFLTRDARVVERKKAGLHRHVAPRSSPSVNFAFRLYRAFRRLFVVFPRRAFCVFAIHIGECCESAKESQLRLCVYCPDADLSGGKLSFLLESIRDIAAMGAGGTIVAG
ncbi:30S ribosomal protein S9 [Bifidobacterium bifidum]|nr:30S ribosomal protein S9 [Bifidobacterium bifidum]